MHVDVDVIERAIAGNDDAFLQMIHAYKMDLYKTALAYLRNEDDALEAVQEVTYRAYRHITTLKNKRYAKTWLIRIMINYCHDLFHNRQRVVHNEQLIHLKGTNDDYNRLELDDLDRETGLIYVEVFEYPLWITGDEKIKIK